VGRKIDCRSTNAYDFAVERELLSKELMVSEMLDGECTQFEFLEMIGVPKEEIEKIKKELEEKHGK